MEPYVIVGGGISGLLTARILQEKNLAYVGFEKTSRLGGRGELGPHRILREGTLSILNTFLADINWVAIECDVQERIKGEFAPIRDGYSEAEKFYLTSHLYVPTVPFDQVTEKIAEPVKDKFHFLKTATQIQGDRKTIEFSDGSEQKFEKLFWCSDLTVLFKMWCGESLTVPKGSKKSSETPSGVNLTFELNSPLFESRNTVVLPFRFKDLKLRALGVPEFDEPKQIHRLHWMIFLPKEVMEDREEVAKCVRTLKRELAKEFSELANKTVKEKIIFLPILSGEETARWASLEIAKDVFYVGPQVYLLEEQSDWRNLDLVVSHATYLRSKNLQPSA